MKSNLSVRSYRVLVEVHRSCITESSNRNSPPKKPHPLGMSRSNCSLYQVGNMTYFPSCLPEFACSRFVRGSVRDFMTPIQLIQSELRILPNDSPQNSNSMRGSAECVPEADDAPACRVERFHRISSSRMKGYSSENTQTCIWDGDAKSIHARKRGCVNAVVRLQASQKIEHLYSSEIDSQVCAALI